jgi:hypothetical protein
MIDGAWLIMCRHPDTYGVSRDPFHKLKKSSLYDDIICTPVLPDETLLQQKNGKLPHCIDI